MEVLLDSPLPLFPESLRFKLAIHGLAEKPKLKNPWRIKSNLHPSRSSAEEASSSPSLFLPLFIAPFPSPSHL